MNFNHEKRSKRESRLKNIWHISNTFQCNFHCEDCNNCNPINSCFVCNLHYCEICNNYLIYMHYDICVKCLDKMQLNDNKISN
jgi:hypothetical protein